MKFKILQDNLRKLLWERIDAGELTGLHLAQQTEFKQAHISNFLNRKRGLSLEGMDKVLAVQHLSVLDLLDPSEVNKRASILPTMSWKGGSTNEPMSCRKRSPSARSRIAGNWVEVT